MPTPHATHLTDARRFLADAGVAAALMAVLLPLTANSLSGIQVPAGWAVAVVTALVVLHASLALRGLAPVISYALACLAMLVVVLAPCGRVLHQSGTTGLARFPMLFLPSSVVFLPVLYSLCTRVGRRLNAAAATTAALGVVLSSVRVGQVVPNGYPVWQYRLYVTVALLLSVSATWGLGTSRAVLTRWAAAQRAEATEAAILAERTRIARDMHDIVAHSLAVIVRQAEGGALVATRAPDRAAQVLRTIADVGREALNDMRGLLGVLREPEHTGGQHPASQRGGLSAGVQSSLADLPALLARAGDAGLRVDLAERGHRHDVGRACELAAHYVIQEALTNVIKHAGPAARAEVTLDWRPDELVVEVRDDGGERPGHDGRPLRPPVPGAGTGLRGLDERVSAVGGSLVVGRQERGFVVRAALPRRDMGVLNLERVVPDRRGAGGPA
jgi:signal transduction histidine kinase